jgi:bifunctional non-homologous end joining protein LigD
LSEHLSDINRDLCCWSFDLLSLEGTELQSFPLIERKARLSCLLHIANLHALRFSDHFDDPKELLAGVPKRHMEGITSKKRDQPYRSGKNPAWITVKTHSWLELNRDRVDLFKA